MSIKRLEMALLAAACGLAISASACVSSSKPRSTATASNEPEFVCADEAPTGSNISRMTCRNRADVDERTRDDQAALQRARMRGASPNLPPVVPGM